MSDSNNSSNRNLRQCLTRQAFNLSFSSTMQARGAGQGRHTTTEAETPYVTVAPSLLGCHGMQAAGLTQTVDHSTEASQCVKLQDRARQGGQAHNKHCLKHNIIG